MFLSSVLLLAVVVPQSRFAAEARPFGALVCGPFPESAPHFRADGGEGSLMDAGLGVNIAGVGDLLSGSVPAVLEAGTSYQVELIADVGATPFRGFLYRLSGTDKDLSGSFSLPTGATDAQLLTSDGEGGIGDGPGGVATCPATVAGATHTSNNDKTSLNTLLEIPFGISGDVILEVTVMVQAPQTWYYSSYPLMIVLEAPTASPTTATPTASIAPSSAPSASPPMLSALDVGLLVCSVSALLWL
jgi:hypothetical protein